MANFLLIYPEIRRSFLNYTGGYSEGVCSVCTYMETLGHRVKLMHITDKKQIIKDTILNDIADFPGSYSELRGGVAGGKGAGYFYLKNNETGVAIEVKTHAEGLAMSVGVTGVTLQMVDEK